MKNKVFLGGTCNESTWRDELIPLLKVDYFNPVVEDWTPEDQEIEKVEKYEKCDIHLYVITSKMTGVFSIAEVIDSAHLSGNITILTVMPDGFNEWELHSLKAVIDLVKLRGGTANLESDITRIANLINASVFSITKKHTVA